jgi:hypothetical protein
MRSFSQGKRERKNTRILGNKRPSINAMRALSRSSLSEVAAIRGVKMKTRDCQGRGGNANARRRRGGKEKREPLPRELFFGGVLDGRGR